MLNVLNDDSDITIVVYSHIFIHNVWHFLNIMEGTFIDDNCSYWSLL